MTNFTVEFSKSPRDGESFKVAELKVEAALDIKIDGKPVHAAGAEYFLAYGIKQALADAYAGDTEEVDASANFDKKLAKIMAGEIPTRGAGVSSETTIGRRLMIKIIRGKMSDTERKAFDDLSQSDKNAKADAMIEGLKDKQADAFAALVAKTQADMEAERKRKAEQARAAAELDIDLGDL